jgi:hypothetical protein
MHYGETKINYEDLNWIEVAQDRIWLQASVNMLNVLISWKQGIS